MVERAIHQLDPAVAGVLPDRKRGMTYAQPRMAALFDVQRLVLRIDKSGNPEAVAPRPEDRPPDTSDPERSSVGTCRWSNVATRPLESLLPTTG